MNFSGIWLPVDRTLDDPVSGATPRTTHDELVPDVAIAEEPLTKLVTPLAPGVTGP
jgi:hypothetical protein